MTRRNLLTTTTACLILATGSAFANDTRAEFAVGGLRFVATDEIHMASEDLRIAPDQIRILYRFANQTDHDIRMEVAFPLPDIDVWELSEKPHDFNRSVHDGDIFNFRVASDGKPVTPAFDVHAIDRTEGKDITDLLRQYKVPLSGVGEGVDIIKRLNQLDPAGTKALVAAHAFFAEDDLRHPNWVVKAAYHWTEVFPARRVTILEQHYQPVLGGVLTNPEDLGKNSPDDPLYDFPKRWCTGPVEAAAAARLKRFEGGPVRSDWLGYVLKTGANWAGPIGQFRLEIDRGKADIMAACPIPGLTQRREPNALIMEGTDFTPATDLEVLYVYGNRR